MYEKISPSQRTQSNKRLNNNTKVFFIWVTCQNGLKGVYIDAFILNWEPCSLQLDWNGDDSDKHTLTSSLLQSLSWRSAQSVCQYYYQKVIFTGPDNRYRHESDDFHTSSWCSMTCWGLFVSYPLFYINCTIIKICLKLMLCCCFFSSSFHWIVTLHFTLHSKNKLVWRWADLFALTSHSCCWNWWGWT